MLAAAPPTDSLEKAVLAVAPRSLFDRRDDSIRALVRIPPIGEERLLADLRRIQHQADTGLTIGVSNSCSGAASFRAGFEEARHALLGSSVLLREPG